MPHCAGFKVIQQTNSMGMYECVDSCENTNGTKYVNPVTRECLSVCPSGIRDKNDICIASLNECAFYRFESSGTSRICISECDSGELVEVR